jgi:hypothetical protein
VRLVRTFPEFTHFALQIPKELARGHLKKDEPLSVFYTVSRPGASDPWQHTTVFWEARKKDFIKSFLQKLESYRIEYPASSLWNLIESGRLVRVANDARRTIATSAAQGSNWGVTVFGVSPGACTESDPFDEPKD